MTRVSGKKENKQKEGGANAEIGSCLNIEVGSGAALGTSRILRRSCPALVDKQLIESGDGIHFNSHGGLARLGSQHQLQLHMVKSG